MLDLETVYKALYDVARVDYDERVFVEGAAGGTGAVRGGLRRAARRARHRARLDRGEGPPGARARRPAYVNRKAPALAGVFVPVPRERASRASWLSAGRKLRRGGTRPQRWRAHRRGRLLGGPRSLRAHDRPARAERPSRLLRGDQRLHADVPRQAGRGAGRGDAARGPVCGPTRACSSTTAPRRSPIRWATRRSARPCTPARGWSSPPGPTPRPRGVKAATVWRGVVSLETLARDAAFRWPDAMPDYDLDPDGYREYQDRTLKPFGQAVGRLLATADNPRGNPDMIVERAGQDTLGVSTFLARPFTGRSWSTRGRRPTTGSRSTRPNVWMHQKRVLFPDVRDPRAATSPTRTRPTRSCGSSTPARSRSSRRPCEPLGRAGRGQPGHPREPPRRDDDRPRGRDRRARRRADRAPGVRGVGLALRGRQGRARAHRPGAPGRAGIGGAGDDRLAARQRLGARCSTISSARSTRWRPSPASARRC